MDINRLNEFITLATLLNYSKAANQLYLTQPALSRHIHDLEQTLGTQLFIRDTHNVHLTSVGEIFLKEAQEIITRYNHALDLIKEVSYGKVDAILVDGSVAQQYQATNDDLTALSFDELGTSADVCVAVAKGDPKGLLPKINEAIAKLTEENKVEEFKQNANALADVWQEVSAPEEE